MRDPQGERALTALLDWCRAMGVDQAAGEMSIDWLQRGDVPPGQGFRLSTPPKPTGASLPQTAPETPRADRSRAASAPPPSRPARPFSTAAPDAAVLAARGAAREAATLDELAARLAGFDGCSLKATAKSLCFYRGAPKARVMLIGEAPGRDEDLEGKPFVGRAGQLLDKMLAAIGLTEADVHITNIVYWRPPGNRTPTPQEAQVCRPFLERQVELVAPEVVVLMGGAAAKHLLEVAEGIMRIRGSWRDIEIGGARARAMATLHPAYLLRTPAAKRLAWRDLLAIKSALSS
jgi:uracil-DNA glycosylase